MAKRLRDTTIWKKQRWFRNLRPIYKLGWNYIIDNCDHAGIYKIEFLELVEDLGVDYFDMLDFIESCNVDYNKANGCKIKRERISMINENTLWITGFIKFQYENKHFLVNPTVHAIHSALTILEGYGRLHEGLVNGYFELTQPYEFNLIRDKQKYK